MPKEYNKRYFNGEHVIDTRKNLNSFRHFFSEEGIIIGMFQGSRGDRPDIDFIVKFLEPGNKRLRTPEHIHWVVDLLLKTENNKESIYKIVKIFLDFYHQAPQFKSVEERDSYQLELPQIIKKSNIPISQTGPYSIDFVAHLVELFTVCEKVSPRENKMFEGLLKVLKEYGENTKDFYQVLNKTKPGFAR